jgi:hypothetical protein
METRTAAASEARRFRRELGLVCSLYFLAAVFHSSWGLPNGNHTWAADAVAPMTPLAVAYKTFLENGFDSGYFYFKYPVGHQLILAAATAPVAAFAYARGDLSNISTDYPFGFEHPEAYLAAMAMIARLLSAIFATGIVALVAEIARRMTDARAGIFAALVAAGCYPLLFYAHTSNVETAFLFWAMLALYGAIRGTEDSRPSSLLLLGAAAALAISTKEQILGSVALLPFVIVMRGIAVGSGHTGLRRALPAGTVGGALVAIVVWLGVNAAFFNPSGFLNRIRFLTHTLPADVRARYAGYEFPIDFSTSWTFADELTHVGKALAAVVSSIGWPAACLALGGIAWAAIRRRPVLLYVLAAAAGYYLVSLRVLKQVEIRYVMPWSVLAAIPAGALLARVSERGRLGFTAAVAVVSFGLFYSGEVLRLLVDDARYEAEAWMAPYLERGHSVEVYQSWTYLPRWTREPSVLKPPSDDTSIAAVQARRPDFIVISSKGKEGITMYPNPDWRDGRGMMLVREDSLRMLEALEDGRLGYERVQRFERRPWIPRELITSLDPAIDIYRRAAAPDPPPLMTTAVD